MNEKTKKILIRVMAIILAVLMAGGTAYLFYLQHNGIGVAVEAYGLHLLHHPGALALMPETLAAAAPVMSLTRSESGLPGLFVHPREHENFACGGVLSYGGNEAVRLGKIRSEIGRSFEHGSVSSQS